MDLMQRIRAFFAKLTYGSYGSDQLGRTILYTSIVLLFLSFALLQAFSGVLDKIKGK